MWPFKKKYTHKTTQANRLIQACTAINTKYEIIFKILSFLYALDVCFISAIHTCTVSLENPITVTEKAACTKAIEYFSEKAL